MKNKTNQNDRNDNCLDNVKWVDFVIEKENRESFESFCRRNQIPFSEVRNDEEEILYRVRDGVDEMDVYTYMLHMTHIPEGDRDEEIWMTLRMMRMYYAPTYEYEYFVFRTEEDQWRLEHFGDHWWPGNDDTTEQ